MSYKNIDKVVTSCNSEKRYNPVVYTQFLGLWHNRVYREIIGETKEFLGVREMKTVFSYAKPYKWPIVIALCLMLIELSVELIQPLIIAKIIDDGILAGDVSVVWTWGSGMMALAFLAFFSGVINSYFAAHAAQSFAFDLRRHYFGKYKLFQWRHFFGFQRRD